MREAESRRSKRMKCVSENTALWQLLLQAIATSSVSQTCHKLSQHYNANLPFIVKLITFVSPTDQINKYIYLIYGFALFVYFCFDLYCTVEMGHFLINLSTVIHEIVFFA